MAPVVLLIATGTLALLATTTTIGLEIALCVSEADNPSLTAASGAAAAVEALALVMIGAFVLLPVVRLRISSSWSRSKLSFFLELLVCIAAAATSIAALALYQQSLLDHYNKSLLAINQDCLIGLAIALTFAAVFQVAFISFYFLAYSDYAIGSASSPSHSSQDYRNKHVKGIRYSQTMPIMRNSETPLVGSRNYAVSAHRKISMGPIDYLRASVTQAIRPTPSRTKLLGFQRRRPKSLELGLESAHPRTSRGTSFDSWDTSSVDAHNRQVVMELSSPTALKRALETIPASPSGSPRSSRPATPLDSGCREPPHVLRRMESYSSSLHYQREANRLTNDSSINELHIHPLFRSDSPTPPPAATPGTSVLAAPHAGLVISRRGSLQSLKRLRSGSLTVGPSPLTFQASHDSLEQSRPRDDGEATQKDDSGSDGRKMTPPIPEWLLSPPMKASLESFKEQQWQGGHG